MVAYAEARHAMGEARRGMGGRHTALQDHEARIEPRNEVLLIYEPRHSLGGQVPRNEASTRLVSSLVTRLGDHALATEPRIEPR